MAFFNLSSSIMGRLNRVVPQAVALAGLLGGGVAMANNTIANGAKFLEADILTSTNRQFQMRLLPHGKLAVFKVAQATAAAPGGPSTEPTHIWESDNFGGLEGKAVLEMKSDNNLVLSDSLGGDYQELLWQSGTAGAGTTPGVLVLRNDGTLHIFSGGASIWNSTTGTLPMVPDVLSEKKSVPAPGPMPAPAPEPTAEPATGGLLRAPVSFHVGGGSSRVDVSFSGDEHKGQATPGAVAFSLGGGSSKVNISLDPQNKDCVVM